jgi:hypothetical protein
MPAMTSGTSRIRAGSGDQPSRRSANAAKDSNTPPGLGVAEVADLDRVEERVAHRRRELDVHLGDERRQHVRWMLDPLGAAAASQDLEVFEHAREI